MAAPRWMSGFAAAALAAAFLLDAGDASAGEDGAWARRVQVLYDATSRSVSRATLSVWDEEPARGLEFLWEPDPAVPFDPPATGGVIEGRGTLVWRVRGSAAYDRSAIYSTYAGAMRDGRRHGSGRLERRDGEVFEGEWVAGQLHGSGMHLDAAGNRYEGEFAAGRPHGEGRQAMADGSIYEGGFRDGLRHGAGRLRLPGGTVYASTWRAGAETGPRPADAMADAAVGGLLRAQADGGAAGKVDLSLVVEQRMTQQSDLRYTHAVLDDRIEIYPVNPGMVEAWIGEATIGPSSYAAVFDIVDWENAPVFLQVHFETRDGGRVRLGALELQVEDSQVYRKPFLSTVGHWGCVPYRPSFSFQNNGWGGVRDATLSFEFFDIEAPDRAAGSYEMELGSFEDGIDVSFDDALSLAGADTAALAAARFSCPSLDGMAQCRDQALASLELGEVGGLLSGGPVLQLGVRGTIAYRWADDRGTVHDQQERFEEAVHVAIIETEQMVAEGGDGWGTSPEALRYQSVHLPDDRQDYVVDLPVRGNRNLAAYTARMKVSADATTIHRFHAVARFEDGSMRRSKPVSLFYIRPKQYHHVVGDPVAQCPLDPGTMPHRE